MAGPVNGVLFDFTGTNGTDLHVWSAAFASPPTGATALEIQSNAATGITNANYNASFTTASYGPDWEIFGTITTPPSPTYYPFMLLGGLQNSGSMSTVDGYALYYASGSITVNRVDNGTLTQLGSAVTQTIGAGDAVRLARVGTAIVADYKASGGSWGEIASRTDTTYTANGPIGLYAYTNSVRIDDVGGGTISSGSATNLTVADATHGHAADAVVLTTTSSLVVADSTHGHAADSVTLSSLTGLTVADSTHSHTADNITLSTSSAVSLTVAEASHAHTAEAPTLSTVWLLTVADATHAHAADAPVLSTDWLLAVADALHAHAADSLTLSTEWLLVVDSSLHGHSAGSVVLSTASTTLLTVQEALHAHVADAVVLLSDSTLQVADSLHAHTAGAVVLTSEHALIVADALHGHTAGAVVLYLPVAMTDSEKLDLILDILSNRQTLDPSSGVFTLYADDGTTVLLTAAAWEDAAGTIPYRGRGLRRLDALE